MRQREALQVRDALRDRGVPRQSRQHVHRHRALERDVHAMVRLGLRIAHVPDRGAKCDLLVRIVRIDSRPAREQFGQIVFDLGLVGRVDHNHEVVFAQAVDDDVVEHVAGSIEDVAVLGPTHLEPGHVVGRDDVEERGRVRPQDVQHTHVRAVEEPRPLAHRRVLVGNRGIPEGHQIARERTDVGLARELDVLVIQNARHRRDFAIFEDELPGGCTSLHSQLLLPTAA